MLSTHHELLDLTSKDGDRHLAPKGGGTTPNAHKGIIVPSPGMLQSCPLQRKNYKDYPLKITRTTHSPRGKNENDN